jgi:hypothetical protein
MPCLVALNWPLNWPFGIGNLNSSVWLYSVLKCGFGNQFRAPPPARPTYLFANSEPWTSVFARKRPVARSPASPEKRPIALACLAPVPALEKATTAAPPGTAAASLPTPPLASFRPCLPSVPPSHSPSLHPPRQTLDAGRRRDLLGGRRDVLVPRRATAAGELLPPSLRATSVLGRANRVSQSLLPPDLDGPWLTVTSFFLIFLIFLFISK